MVVGVVVMVVLGVVVMVVEMVVGAWVVGEETGEMEVVVEVGLVRVVDEDGVEVEKGEVQEYDKVVLVAVMVVVEGERGGVGEGGGG